MSNTDKKINHIAFIIDGNRRWADKQNLLKRYLGHNKGIENVENIIKKCQEREIKIVTIWALSTENWKKRSKEELKNIFKLLKDSLQKIDEFTKNNTRFKVIGDITELPQDIQDIIIYTEEKTKNNDKYYLNIGLNYGGQDELIRSIQKILKQNIDIKSLTQDKNFLRQCIENNLDTFDITPPDLIIRTGGHTRTSGFMIWQSVYSEWYFTDTLWPDFDEKELDNAIEYFYNCIRNFGK